MSSEPIRPLPPRPSGPERHFDGPADRLVGCREDELRSLLGKPDARTAGRYWHAPEAPPPGTVERNSVGQLVPLAVFGPVPQRIPPGQPYEEWTYGCVNGETWRVYLSAAQTPQRQRVVVEVIRHPPGAVF